MFRIELKNFDEVSEFVDSASKSNSEINLEGGSVYIDAKSFLGVLSMGLNRKLNVRVIGEDQEFLSRIKKFAVA
jgi:phosphotransferase system HPr-like phosphotransfer protein